MHYFSSIFCQANSFLIIAGKLYPVSWAWSHFGYMLTAFRRHGHILAPTCKLSGQCFILCGNGLLAISTHGRSRPFAWLFESYCPCVLCENPQYANSRPLHTDPDVDEPWRLSSICSHCSTTFTSFNTRLICCTQRWSAFMAQGVLRLGKQRRVHGYCQTFVFSTSQVALYNVDMEQHPYLGISNSVTGWPCLSYSRHPEATIALAIHRMTPDRIRISRTPSVDAF